MCGRNKYPVVRIGHIGGKLAPRMCRGRGMRAGCETEFGKVVIFNGRAPHMSGPNTSSKSRHAYTLHVIDRACHYPEDNWLQRSDELPLRGFDN